MMMSEMTEWKRPYSTAGAARLGGGGSAAAGAGSVVVGVDERLHGEGVWFWLV